MRTLRLPLIEDRDELETAIRFQAPEQIAMPLEQAVIDWQVLEPDPETVARKQIDVVVVAARREAVAGMTEALKGAGLKPVGNRRLRLRDDPRARTGAADRALPARRSPTRSGWRRATARSAMPAPARLFCNLGDVTNLAVARGTSCLFTRVSAFGIEGIAQRLAERRGLTLEHARQWLLHVGLEAPIESIEGDPDTVRAARAALEEGAGKLAGELRLSLDYYGTQEGAVAIEEIVVCGPGTAIAGLPAAAPGRPRPRAASRPAGGAGHLDEPEAARLTLPYGLALEE